MGDCSYLHSAFWIATEVVTALFNYLAGAATWLNATFLVHYTSDYTMHQFMFQFIWNRIRRMRVFSCNLPFRQNDRDLLLTCYWGNTGCANGRVCMQDVCKRTSV